MESWTSIHQVDAGRLQIGDNGAARLKCCYCTEWD